MNRLKLWALLLLCGISLCTISCSDDDNNNSSGNPEELSPDDKYSEQAVALLTVLDALAEVDSLPDNWNTSAFSVEATYGRALDAANPYVRSEAVSGAEEAIAIFNDLTGEEADASTQTKTWTCEGVGSLTYTLKNLSDCTATIDVNVPKLRGLTQIRLVPAEAIGENGTFTGTPYYTVGDVVSDSYGKYWICARGAYSPAKKEDTHWFSFSLLKENIKVVHKEADYYSYFPTKLGSNTEKMRYLVQFLKFVAAPDAYKDENGQLDATCYPKGVGNLGRDYLSWEQMNEIATNWYNKQFLGRNFIPTGVSDIYQDNQKTFKEYFEPQAYINIFYKGYSKSLFGTYTIFCKKYTGKECEEHSHDDTWSTSSLTTFSILDYAAEGNAYVTTSYYKGLVVRYKTGKELNGGKSLKATEAIKGVDEIYRYNDKK